MSGDLENGLVAARLAVELNPSMPEALGWLSWNLLVAELPDYYIGHVLVAMNLAELGRFEEARDAIAAARQIQPDLSQELFQAMYGVSRPEVDARRNALLSQLGVE